MKPKLERRIMTVPDLSVRSAEGEARKLVGHAAVFDKRCDLGYFVEIVRRGAFSKTIGEDDVRALFNHDSSMVLGRNKAGTLTMREDEVGLAVEITPPDTQLARDLQESISRGDITQMSFGFYAREFVNRKEGDVWVRELTDCQLFDVSVVTYPAYEETDVEVRSLADVLESIRRGPEDPALAPNQEWEHDLARRGRLIQLAEQL